MEDKFKELYEHATCVLQFLSELSASDIEIVMSLAVAIYLNAKIDSIANHSDDQRFQLFNDKEQVKQVAETETKFDFFSKIDLQLKAIQTNQLKNNRDL